VESYKEMIVNGEILFAEAKNQLPGAKTASNRGILGIDEFFISQNR
jgi:hypothetical protein